MRGLSRPVIQVCVIALIIWTCGPAHAAQSNGSRPSSPISSAVVRASAPGAARIAQRWEPGGMLTIRNIPAADLLRLAYGLFGVEIEGLPAWTLTQRFDIDAVASANDGSREIGPILKPVLEKYFRLRYHIETREAPVYLLTRIRADQLGPSLRPSQLDCADHLVRFSPVRGERSRCAPGGGSGVVSGDGITLADLVNVLKLYAGRPIIDRTDLTGRYDVDLSFSTPAQPAAPQLFTAVQEQLGLTLEPARGPASVIVIDNIERPD